MEKKDSFCLRIAHLSDLHFSESNYGIRQFFSKRWLGNLNLLLFRKKAYQTAHLWHLPELLKSLNVEKVLITGDFSTTSLDGEFEKGKKLVEAFCQHHLEAFSVPGNHDCYTKEVQKKFRYHDFFPSKGLKEKKIEVLPFGKGWWYIGLDCTIATPLFCSYGLFSEAMERELIGVLSQIPPEDRVIMANHFPLLPSKNHRPQHDLKRGLELQNILKQFSQVKIYLHGHDHQRYIIDRQNEGLPLIVNSGSCAHKPNGTFYLIDLFDQECLIQRLFFQKEGPSFSWIIDWQQRYALRICSKNRNYIR